MFAISIIGAGWLGLAAAQHWASQGHTVRATTTTPEKHPAIREASAQPILLRLAGPETVTPSPGGWDGLLGTARAVLVCFPPRLRGGQPPIEYLSQIDTLVAALRPYNGLRVLFTSSTGVYPDDGHTWAEDDLPPDTHSPNPLLAAEGRIATLPQSHILRLGGLWGPDREPARYFAGKQAVAAGLAPVNLTHLHEALAALDTVLHHPTPPPVLNVVSPEVHTRQDWYTARCQALGLPLPTFLPETLPGKRVSPARWVGLQP